MSSHRPEAPPPEMWSTHFAMPAPQYKQVRLLVNETLELKNLSNILSLGVENNRNLPYEKQMLHLVYNARRWRRSNSESHAHLVGFFILSYARMVVTQVGQHPRLLIDKGGVLLTHQLRSPFPVCG